MRMTKVIRDYFEAELSKKRMEINANDPLTVAYKARRKACIEEISALVKNLRNETMVILEKYGMDTKSYNERPAVQDIISFRDGNIINTEDDSLRRDREQARYNEQKSIMNNIELECALGGDKEFILNLLEKGLEQMGE